MALSFSGITSSLGFNLGNQSEYPISGNNYFVILGTSMLSFSRISGIVLHSTKNKAVNEGGMNEPYIVEEPNNSLNTLVFEKGYGTADVLSMVDKAKVMLLIIRGPGNTIKGAFYTSKMMVKEVSISDLDAVKSEVLIQKMTVSYTYLKKSNAIIQMAEMGLLDSVMGMLNYNDNSDERNEVKAYSAKLTAQKQQREAELANQRTSLAAISKPTASPDVSEASNTNKKVAQEQAKKKIEEEQTAKERELQIKSRLDI